MLIAETKRSGFRNTSYGQVDIGTLFTDAEKANMQSLMSQQSFDSLNAIVASANARLANATITGTSSSMLSMKNIALVGGVLALGGLAYWKYMK